MLSLDEVNRKKPSYNLISNINEGLYIRLHNIELVIKISKKIQIFLYKCKHVESLQSVKPQLVGNPPQGNPITLLPKSEPQLTSIACH